MKYLFFDIEGANCYNYISKMCTFGYVLTDEKYNVKSKIDVVMNPESPFDKHIIKEQMNAYPLAMYNSRPPFGYFYKSIKNILEAPEQLIIGWSVDNDVKYIYDACKRYNLKQINYKYLDMQKVYMDIFELTNQPSLETVCLNHNIAVKKAHKSDDDAFLTMLVSKIICKKLEITLPELFEKYKHLVSNVETYASHLLTDEQISIRLNRRKINNLIKVCKRKRELSCPLINEDEIYGFDIAVIDSLQKELNQVIRYIVDCGGKCSNNLQECTTVICIKQKNKPMLKTYGLAKVLDYKKIVKYMNSPIKNK